MSHSLLYGSSPLRLIARPVPRKDGEMSARPVVWPQMPVLKGPDIELPTLPD